MTPPERDSWLRAVLTRVSGKSASDVASSADLEEAIGLDSLGRLEVLSEIEDEFDFFFDDTAFATTRTIERMLKEIDRHTETGTEGRAQ